MTKCNYPKKVNIDTATYRKNLGRRIKKLRGKVSPEDFANELGITARTLEAWETGKSIPTLANLILIAFLCSVSLTELVTGYSETDM